MRPIRVIFATQNPALASDIAKALAPLGVEVIAHDSLLGLYPAVLKEEPDVILLDGDLPRLALEAAARFLRTKGASRRQPIVLLVSSGDDAPDPGLLVAACQADDFLDRSAPAATLARALTKLARAAAGPFDDLTEPGDIKLASVSGTGKPGILVVDDDPSIAQLLQRMLDARYDVTVVINGKAAIAHCATREPAAIFCDLMMPGVSGADVYRSIRAANPALADRIVFVTAHSLDAAEAEFFMGLTNHVVHKPFSLREILSIAAKIAPITPA